MLALLVAAYQARHVHFEWMLLRNTPTSAAALTLAAAATSVPQHDVQPRRLEKQLLGGK